MIPSMMLIHEPMPDRITLAPIGAARASDATGFAASLDS